MGKKLIITEKPSVARDYARVLGVSGNNQGYIENDEYVITWCVGHLVEMVYPEEYDARYKKWILEDLPFLPQTYKYGIIKNVSGQYDIVHRFLHRDDIDTVYWAGDSGKEGQTIEENIRNFGGVRAGMDEKRVWIDSQTDEEIKRGINEAKPMSDYANLGFSGIMRSIEDYAMGINFSRVMSIKYGKLLNDAAATKDYTAIAIGRVMTCVLGMVVNREREIRDFKENFFYRVCGSFTDANVEAEWKAVEGSKYFESPKLYKENGFKTKEDAQELIASLQGKQPVIKSFEQGTSKKKAPLLFNLAELQAECSKRFKISPAETLQVAQDLYEKKLTTYPRTDARVLTTAVAKEISKNLYRLKAYEPTAAFTDKILGARLYNGIEKTSYTDDSKVTDHYAIIPTGELRELSGLTDLQRRVFDLIVRRFLSIFYPAAEYATVKMTINVDTESFFTSGKVLKALGYLEVMGKTLDTAEDDEDKNSLENQSQDGELSYKEKQGQAKRLLAISSELKVGDEVSNQGYVLREGKTSPPKRYTSGSLILAMENAGQFIEDEELRAQIKGSGIGTSATRAEIIAKLIRIGYLNLNQKSQIITPENFGEMVYEVVNMTVPSLLNPKMTASWEKGLDGITQGTVDMGDYRAKLEDYIRRETVHMRDNDITSPLASRISNFRGKGARGLGAKKTLECKCPVCGGDIVTTPFGYGCSNYNKDDENSCRFAISQIAGRDLSEEEVITLIRDGQTPVLSGFVSKTKKKFQSKLVMTKDEEGKIQINFDFSENTATVLEDVTCPDCGGRIEIIGATYRCEHFNQEDPQGCKFWLGKIADKDLSQAVVKELLTEKRTQTIRGFKGKSGKKFDACLLLDKDEAGKTVIKFDFENTEAKKIKDVACPICGGDIVKTPFGFGCANYKKDDPDSCRFSIGKMAEKDIPEASIKELLTNGRTGTLRGFKSKTGTKFDARIALNRDENGAVIGLKFDFDELERQKIKDVVCPNCGGDIVKTPFGYGCSNYNKDDENSCRFTISKIAEKELPEAAIKDLLTDGRTATLRGFKSKSGKKFDARIALNKDENGKVIGLKFDFDDIEQPKLKDVRCPICGGEVTKTQFGYGCTGYNPDEPEKSCRFAIGRIGSLKLNDSQVKELLTHKKTGVIQGFIAKSGKKFDAALKLNSEGQVVFDFPERPAPVETVVTCPRCKDKKLKKDQWYYICDCGFKIGHTVAKVALTDEILSELFETGKTKKKIIGFTSKAGNVFDACLKYENEMISFDFDNPGEAPANEQPSGNLGADLEKDGPVVTMTTVDDGFEAMYANMASEEIQMEEEMALENEMFEQSLGELPWN